MTELHFGDNQLVRLPDSIAALTALRELRLENNQLVTLPDSIAAMAVLESLSISYNNFVTLPDSIGALTALGELYLYDNPLAKPQSTAVEVWLAVLLAGSCTVAMPQRWFE